MHSSTESTAVVHLRSPSLLPVVAAAAYFLIEWVANAFFGYGIFIDELYYLSCAKRLAAGYVDHPPLSIWFLRAASGLGDSVASLRLWPALAGGAVIYLAGRLAQRLGGSRRAVWLAVLATAGAPVLMVLFGFYSMNAFETLFVLALVSIALMIQDGAHGELWVLFGGLVGLAFLNKHTSAVYTAALLLGVLCSPGRAALRSRWLFAGGAIALCITLPNVLWQVRNDWVSLEFYRNATVYKNVSSSPAKVVLDQVLAANLAALPMLLAGLYYGMRSDRRMMFVAFAYLALLALLAFSGSSRPDRIAALFPALFAAGGVQIERWSVSRPWLPGITGALIAVGAAAFAPVGLPLLPPPQLASYARALRVIPKIERGSGTVPLWFANRFGWQAVASAVERAAIRLAPEERAHAAVLGASYGDSGACEHLGRALPPVFGRHNAWHGWGVPAGAPTVLLLVGFEEAEARTFCGELSVAATYTRPFTADIDRAVWICRDLTKPLLELWPSLRRLM